MSSFIPQLDPNRLMRGVELKAAQLMYRYNYTHVSPLAIVDRVPVQDQFSFSWLMQVGERVMTALANRADLELNPQQRDHYKSRFGQFRQLINRGEAATLDLRNLVHEALLFEGRKGAEPARPESLEDFANLFRKIGLPPVAKGYQDDRAFSWMRVAGPNPVVLQRWREPDSRLSLTDADLQVAAAGDTLDAAFAEGRMYLADYSLLDGAELSDYPNGQKYLYAPLAAFVVEKSTGNLLPVAIQCRQTPAEDNPVFTPNDGYNWLIAKTIVEVADGNMHEAFTHLGRTHLFIEPFVVSTFRQLSSKHPLALLLTPHFQGTLAINAAAWQHLIADKGAVDKLFGGSIETSRGVAVKSVQTADVTKVLLPHTFIERGVDDAEALRDYPYRDDALLYWEAIQDWVMSYLRLYYESDGDVIQDEELQAWGQELASRDGGRINGLPNGGSLQTVPELVDVATLLIYTSSVQHAAVNFPQYDLMSYAPNMPLASYTPAPTSKTGASEADYLAMLPTLDMAELQQELGYLLGTVHYTQLGQYAPRHFNDERVSTALNEFQRRLAEIGGRIEERNRGRFRAYETLDPAGVPQSINI